jgi:MFS family permease
MGDRPARAPAGGPRAGQALLLSLAMAQFMVVLDFTIVNVALPSIQRDLHVATMTLQWLVSAYAVAFGGFLLRAAGRRLRPGQAVPDRPGRVRRRASPGGWPSSRAC